MSLTPYSRLEELRALRDEAEAEAVAGHAGWGFGAAEREELAELEYLAEQIEAVRAWRDAHYPSPTA